MQRSTTLAAFDVRRVDQADDSRVRLILKATLPPITRKNVERNAGGGMGSVNHVIPATEPFEPKFDTRGVDVSALESVGLMTGQTGRWIFAASYIERSGYAPIAFRAIIQGVISDFEPGELSIGDGQDWTHTIKEVTHYEAHRNGKELWYWDDDEMLFRIGGNDIIGPHLRALGLG